VGFSVAVKGAGNAVFSCSACASDAMGVYLNWSYVAINSELVKTALKKIQNDKLKGKTFRVRILS
jgi:hypothetical protein